MQQVPAAPEWQGHLTEPDLRALRPLKWLHINPGGTFTLDVHERLPLNDSPARLSWPKFRPSLG